MEVEVKVKGISQVSPVDVEMVLEEVSGERQIKVYIGVAEAMLLVREQSIKMEGMPSSRPGTYDLLLNVAEHGKMRATKVVITELRDNTYYANIHFEEDDGSEFKLDARPSNAVPFAIAADVPVFVEEDILKQAETISSEDPEGGIPCGGGEASA